MLLPWVPSQGIRRPYVHWTPGLMYTTYERTVINGLIEMFPDLQEPLQRIVDRPFDLHPVVKEHYYHPKMLGSWSIKAVLPCIAPHMNYAELDGIKEGMGASDGFLEAIGFGPEGPPTKERKAELEEQLLRYCKFDTSTESLADDYVKETEVPVMDKLVEEGKITSWGWQSHVIGGWFRRLFTMTATDYPTLMDARGEALAAQYGEDNAAGAEFAGICGNHNDYLWDVVHEKQAAN